MSINVEGAVAGGYFDVNFIEHSSSGRRYGITSFHKAGLASSF
jgi:hypothetical protein